MNFLPVIRMPHDSGGLKLRANSLIGAPPRNRNIGLSSELPAVNSIASRPPSSSSHFAVCSDSSIGMPPRTPSDMFSFAVTAIWSPTASLTASTAPRATLARLYSDPPNSSVRRLISGDRNELAR